MSGNTSSNHLRTGLAARRRKIAKACDFCREHRVRCEAATPCPQCVANNITCRRSRPSCAPQKRNPALRENEANQRSTNRRPIDNIPINGSQCAKTEVPIPSPSSNLAWTSQRTDSTLGFIARIDAFCSGPSQISHTATLSDNDPALDQSSPFPPGLVQGTDSADCNLSPAQTNHLMRVFWSRLSPLMPIVQWEDLKLSSKQDSGTSSPLQDAITVYSLHYVYQTRLHTRLVGLDWPQFELWQSRIGLPYFQRSFSAVTQFTIVARPSISVLQCYCYLTLYLLNAGHQQAAYHMVGLALRIAHSLNYMDARNGGYQECQLFRRIWWSLIQIEFRCSKHVGKPMSIMVDDVMCLRPTREPSDTYLSNGLLYHTESIRLTAAALVVSELMDHHCRHDSAAEPPQIETRAKTLSGCLLHIRQWCDGLSQEQLFADISFDVPDMPPVSQEALDPQDEHTEQSPVVTLLKTLLLLQYHNVMVGLHRVFIQFPSYLLFTRTTPKADALAATGLNHALAMIRIAHHRMAVHDILHGFSEIYQYLWNAGITIIGFLLAYPYCHRCSRAREYLDLALEIFDSAGSENCVAIRAASLTRHLCSKVDTMIQTLNINQAPDPLTAESGPYQNEPSGPGSALPTIQNEGIQPPSLDEESLWPSVDLIDVDAWPAYCDEVNNAFFDLAGLTTLQFDDPGP